MISRVVIPDLGAAKGDVVLTEWLVKPGDFVKAGSPLFVVTTDKASDAPGRSVGGRAAVQRDCRGQHPHRHRCRARVPVAWARSGCRQLFLESVPLVLRLPVGATGRGAQHGQCTEAFFLHTPGLKVVCPSNPYDAKGLLLAAIRDENPVIFLEHKLLYGAKGGRQEKATLALSSSVPEEVYEVPLGTVAVTRTGTDVTILANMLMVHRALAAADELAREGVSAEVIDMRCLVPLDMDTLVSSVTKTGRVLIVEEDNLTGGWGAEIAARLMETAFDALDAPITRVAAPDTPLPCAPALERVYVPGVEQVVQGVRRLMGG